eukprot:scaffold5250_cov102-Isochrysis_galbana.AAC.7
MPSSVHSSSSVVAPTPLGRRSTYSPPAPRRWVHVAPRSSVTHALCLSISSSSSELRPSPCCCRSASSTAGSCAVGGSVKATERPALPDATRSGGGGLSVPSERNKAGKPARRSRIIVAAARVFGCSSALCTSLSSTQRLGWLSRFPSLATLARAMYLSSGRPDVKQLATEVAAAVHAAAAALRSANARARRMPSISHEEDIKTDSTSHERRQSGL